MSDYLACVTNDMPDVRSCTVAGEHYESCDGFERRHREVWDPDRRKNVWVLVHERGGHPPCAACLRPKETLRPCPGCIPAPAAVGCVCMRCWRALQLRWSQWEVLEPFLAKYAVLSPRDGGGSRSPHGPRVPLPATFLAWEEVRRTLTDEPQTPELWVSRFDGAANAVRFTIAVAKAVAAHPHKEEPRKLQRMRCLNCKQLVVWMPPAGAYEPLTVKCEGCGRTITEDEQWTTYRKTRDGWEGRSQAAIDVVAEIEMQRKSVMSVMDDEQPAIEVISSIEERKA